MGLRRLFWDAFWDGPGRLLYRETMYRVLSSHGSRIELTDADIQRSVRTALDALTKAQSAISTLTDSVNKRKAELDKLLEECERVSGLAAIDGEKAGQLLKELGKRDRKTLVWTAVLSFVMILVGFVLSHFARLWFPALTL